MILSTLITVVSNNIGQTVTLASVSVTCKPLWISAQHVTGALLTVIVDSISKVSLNTSLTVETLSLKQTLETLTRERVTVTLSSEVPVVGAITGFTLSSR